MPSACPRAPRVRVLLAIVSLAAAAALLLGSCAGSSSDPTAAPSPSSSGTLAPEPSSTPTATPAPSPTPAPTPVVFDSVAYGYRAAFPAGQLVVPPTEALERWDGQAVINSDGPYTDKFYLPGNRLLFVYGAATDLQLADYAIDGQLKKHEWHDCPETPERLVDTTFGGEPAIFYSVPCQGLQLFSVFTVRDGFGLVINQLTPPVDVAADEAAFLDLLASWILLE